jgi:hypothetical protein
MTHGTALIQKGLNSLGYTGSNGKPLAEDGIYGDNTAFAARAWLAAGGQPRNTPAPVTGQPVASAAYWPKQADVARFFGAAGSPDCTAGRCQLPFAFPLAWDADQRLTSFSCHKLVAEPLTRIFANAAKQFGEATFRLMRLDQFGGCYNYRQMRGGSSLSMHSWGIAVDLDPVNNGLTTRAPQALFSGDDYEPFWRIVEAEGFYSLGRRENRDWMHFEATSR